MDSGSLLGVIREGDLLSWDSDVDLGMWMEDAKVFEKHIETFTDTLITVKPRYYLGQLYGYTIKPKIRTVGFKEIHIHVFYHSQFGLAWSPQTIVPYKFVLDEFETSKKDTMIRNAFSMMNAYSRRKVSCFFLKKWVLGALSYPVVILYGFGKSKLDRYDWATRYPYKASYLAGTWLVDSVHYDELEKIAWQGEDLWIPSRAREYLALRYGESWEKPAENWVYYRDDGCLILGGPEKILIQKYVDKFGVNDSELSHIESETGLSADALRWAFKENLSGNQLDLERVIPS